jgi:hypothetical protein
VFTSVGCTTEVCAQSANASISPTHQWDAAGVRFVPRLRVCVCDALDLVRMRLFSGPRCMMCGGGGCGPDRCMGAFAVCALSQQSLFLSHTRRLISLLNGPESALGVRAAAGVKTLALGGGDVTILYEKRSRRNNI